MNDLTTKGKTRNCEKHFAIFTMGSLVGCVAVAKTDEELDEKIIESVNWKINYKSIEKTADGKSYLVDCDCQDIMRIDKVTLNTNVSKGYLVIDYAVPYDYLKVVKDKAFRSRDAAYEVMVQSETDCRNRVPKGKLVFGNDTYVQFAGANNYTRYMRIIDFQS